MTLKVILLPMLILLSYCSSAQLEVNKNDLLLRSRKDEQKSLNDYELIIKGHVSNLPSISYLMIYETQGRDFFLYDSTIIEQGTFSLKLENLETGVYKIGIADDEMHLGEVILNPKEKIIELTYTSSDLTNGPSKIESIENEAYLKFQILYKEHQQNLFSIKRSNKGRQEKELQKLNEEAKFQLLKLNLAKEYPETFFSNIITKLQSPERFNKNQYWKDMDFEDRSLIHSTVFPSRLEDYMRLHATKFSTPQNPHLGYYNAVDFIANEITDRGDDRVLEFVLYTMSEGFYASGLEDVSLYIIDNYFYGDRCGDTEISELFKEKARGVKNLQIGCKVPGFRIKDSKTEQLDLAKVASENNLTLLLFWSSYCEKCVREIADLKTIYQTYETNGFEVIGISVDTNYKSFLNGVENNSTTWPNSCDTKGWRGTITKEYRVTSTPALFLLDENLTLLLKPKSTTELKTYFQTSNRFH